MATRAMTKRDRKVSITVENETDARIPKIYFFNMLYRSKIHDRCTGKTKPDCSGGELVPRNHSLGSRTRSSTPQKTHNRIFTRYTFPVPGRPMAVANNRNIRTRRLSHYLFFSPCRDDGNRVMAKSLFNTRVRVHGNYDNRTRPRTDRAQCT